MVSTVFPDETGGAQHNFFPEMSMAYMDRKVSLPGAQISHLFDLILTNKHGSIKNMMHIKTSNQHISLNIQPNSKIFISESSVRRDLSNHGNKMKKQEIRIPTFLKNSVMISWIRTSSSSRSPLSTLL